MNQIDTSVRVGVREPARAATARERRRSSYPRPHTPPDTVALLFATAAAEGGGAAAELQWEDGTIIGRLVEQFDWLGVSDVRVVTRPSFAEGVERALEGAGAAVRLVVSEDLAQDLRIVADLAHQAGGPLVVGLGDIVTRDQAVAGLLADPRVSTGILATAAGYGRPFTFRTRTSRGRVVSAASQYHTVDRPNHRFLGVLRVAPAEQPALAGVAERLAELATPPLVPEWEAQFGAKASRWRARMAGSWRYSTSEEEEILTDEPPEEPPQPAIDDAPLGADDEAELRRRVEAAGEDVTALLLVGLVRSSVPVASSYVRKLYWARPLSRRGIDRVRERLERDDEDKVLLDSAVKPTDGFFTTFFVSPYSKYIARWAARRGLTPNQVTTVSMLIGAAAAGAFATGTRPGLVAGAVLLQAAFTADCVDGQLARYTRTFSKFGAWLDSILDRTKEYLVFAGLGIGAAAGGDPVWLLACAALTLQTVRHTMDVSHAASVHEVFDGTRQQPLETPSDRPPATRRSAKGASPARVRDDTPLSRRLLHFWRRVDALPGALWVKRMAPFPIGERFAVISITAALFTPRVTFTVLLAWGGFAACYSTAGRLLRSVR